MDEIDYAQEYQAKDIAAALSRRRKMEGTAATHCHDCGEPIPEARRTAAPGTTLCIDCQRALERR